MITCQTVALTSHRWRLNNFERVSYTFHESRLPPLTLYDQDGITVVITDADAIDIRSDIFNATSVLSTTLGVILMLPLNTVQCGTNAFRSELVNLSGITAVAGTIVNFHAYIILTNQRKNAAPLREVVIIVLIYSGPKGHASLLVAYSSEGATFFISSS